MLFYVFDSDQDYSVDFRELVSGLSVLCRGSIHQKMKLVFRLIDCSDDQLIDKEEMTKILLSIYNVDATNTANNKAHNNQKHGKRRSIDNGTNNNSSNNNNNNNTLRKANIFQKLFSSNNTDGVNSNHTSPNISPNSSPYVTPSSSPSFSPIFSPNTSPNYKRVSSQQVISYTQPTPIVDHSNEVAFFVDMLFKASENYIKKTYKLQRQSLTRINSMKIPVNTNPAYMNFEQFREVILLQPLIVDCFHLGTAAPRFHAPPNISL